MYLLYFALLSTAGAQLYSGLKVTWGINIFSDYVYADVPRTISDAEADGWVPQNEACEGGFYRGIRYIKFDENIGRDDHAVMPLYDVNGYIAGIQTAFTPDSGINYPTDNIIPPLILDSDLNMYTMTAYFVNPDIICGPGRTQAEFEQQGTGDRVVLQNGADLTTQPASEDGIAGTEWTEGQCFATMGKHYWWDVTADMSCDDFWPMFLLYNGNQLTAFGWAFQGNFDSLRYEHPTSDDLGLFLPIEYPECLNEIPFFSTIHVYLTDNPLGNFC